jgi:response regulator RpfG family c-di-GMP phosphodiesterase
MNNKILFVDDDAQLLASMRRALHGLFLVETALGGAEGLLKMTSNGPYAVVVADMQMPDMSGLEFLCKVQTQAPQTVRMMLTGNSDSKTAVRAVNDGRVFHFLNKPCLPEVLVPAIDAGLAQYRLQEAERQLLEDTLGGAVKVLTEILSLADPTTFDRSQKLRDYVRDFSRSIDSTPSWELELAAMLSQIGRITVPPAVLEKMRNRITLTGPEKDVANRVPEFGANLIANIPRLENVANLVRYHNKNFDGSGSPADTLAGEEIPIGARILNVLNALIEAETASVSRPAAFQRMMDQAGHFDHKVVAAVSRWCDVALIEPARGKPLTLRVQDLMSGQVLAQDLRTTEGLLIVAANTKLSGMLLVKILNFERLNSISKTLLVYPE